MEAQPKEINPMPPAVSPIKNERTDKVCQTAARRRRHPVLRVKDGPLGEPSLPGYACQQDYPKLESIDQHYAIWHVRTAGSFQPGTQRSKMRQQAANPNMYGSITRC